MRMHRRVDVELHIATPPGSVRAGGIDEPDGKLIQIFQGAGDCLTGSDRNRHFRFRVPRIEHLPLEFETLVTGCDSRKIAGRRVTGGASTCTVEVSLTGFSISGLQIGWIHALATTGSGERLDLLRVDESNDGGHLIIRAVKG